MIRFIYIVLSKTLLLLQNTNIVMNVPKIYVGPHYFKC